MYFYTNKKKPVEAELAKTNLIVEEKPLEVLEPLKTDKPEYKEGEDILLSIKLSKPLQDKEKCMSWCLNGKPLDMKSKQLDLNQTDEEDGVVYTLKIKSAEIGKNDGVFVKSGG